MTPGEFCDIAKYFSFIDINLPSVEILDKLQFEIYFTSLPKISFDDFLASILFY